MELSSLAMLVEVAHFGSFAAVARSRGLDPSSVSRIVASLEAELGIRLFQRTTRRLVPTEAGAAYLARIEPVLAELEHARLELEEGSAVPSGELRLTSSVAFGTRRIVPLLPALIERYPRMRVELVVSDERLDLVAERIDLAVRLGPRPEFGPVLRKLRDTRYRVCASPGWAGAKGWKARPGDLAQLPCLRFALPGFRDLWRFRDPAGRIEEVTVGGPLRISNALTLREAALAGMGAAMLADWLIEDDLVAGRLIDLLPDHAATATSFETAAWLLYPSRALLPAKVRVAIDLLVARLGPAGGSGI